MMSNENIIKQNELQRSKWLKTQQITHIPVSSIILKEKIHKESSIKFTRQINYLRSKNIQVLNNPIVVKREGDNKYSLVTGYKGLCIAQALYHTIIPAVITDKSRDEHLKEVGYGEEYFWMPIDKVLVPRKFLKSKVSKNIS